ncbi:MAG: type II toxin-antitoxin system MqsA family antitoxin [bacterium]|nr:type II toxin-antitoxin system MqsA family antitoxin [bacterium]
MICDVCGKGGVRIRKVNETYGKNKDLLVIEDIPMVCCPNCGESYFTAETLHELERIKLHKDSFAQPRTVAVAGFVQAPERIAG